MLRTVCLLAAVLVGSCPLGSAQSLGVLSAYDQSPPPFYRTEVVTFALTGAEPFRPVTFFIGPGITPVSIPGIQGSLAVHPGFATAFGGLDGLGIFGGNTPVVTNASGSITFSVLIPAAAGASLPFVTTIQAIVAQSPILMGGQIIPAYILTNGVTVTVVEPPPQSVANLAAVAVPTGPHPQVLPEGSGFDVIVRSSNPATGFLPETSVVPQVDFITAGGLIVPAVSVTLIDEDPTPPQPGQPNVSAALVVKSPPQLGAATNPPFTNAGPITLRVSWAATGVYQNAMNAEAMTAPTGPSDPTFLVFQSAVIPQLAQVTPQAGLTMNPCPVTLLGAGFLHGAQVLFNGVPGTDVSVSANGQVITVDPPSLPRGAQTVSIRNPDHFPLVPRETLPNPPATTWTSFNFAPSDVIVTGVSPTSAQEGAGGEMLQISGTCPVVAGYTALDPRSGLTFVALGSELAGMAVGVPIPVTSVLIPAPGTFLITAQAPEFPPGLNPVGPTAGGHSNTGKKHLRIFAPSCLNPAGVGHKTFAAIPGLEPGNAFTYRAAVAPTVSFIEPNNCGRVDGGQTVLIRGDGFFTNDVVLPSPLVGLAPSVALLASGVPNLPFTVLRLIDDQTLEAVAPDASTYGLALPFSADLLVTNPDGQGTDPQAGEDDFFLYPSLAGGAANPIVPMGSTLTVNSGTVGSPVVFTVPGDFVIPVGFTLRAVGEVPLVIRVRGNVELQGTVDLSGTPAGMPPPAGGGMGGGGLQAGMLALENPTQGRPGMAVLDPATGVPYGNAFGGGGLHGTTGSGGGGGAMLTAGLMGQAGINPGGMGGMAYGISVVPVPVIGTGFPAEFLAPPGGSGGGAGGLGLVPPLSSGAPPPEMDTGFNGAGGHGGGGCLIAADGVITVRAGARLLVLGHDGAPGQSSLTTLFAGGGGGGGAGGSFVLQSLQGIRVESGGGTTALSALGAAGGAGGGVGNDGGAGGNGAIRLAIPLSSAFPGMSLIVQSGTVITPPADFTGF